MYGDTANKLIQEARRAMSLDVLPQYQELLVQSIIREVRELSIEIQELRERYDLDPTDPTLTCPLIILALCIHRNKRCLLGYQKMRSDRIDQLVWAEELDTGEGLLNQNLNVHEHEYLRNYSELIINYKSEWTDIDLTGSMIPPRDLFIDVRVLKDAGEIQTEYGVFNLTKNSQFFVRESDVHRLIQQGYLKKL